MTEQDIWDAGGAAADESGDGGGLRAMAGACGGGGTASAKGFEGIATYQTVTKHQGGIEMRQAGTCTRPV